MHLLNLTISQFLVLFGSVSAVMLALYLLDRSRRRQVVSTLRFWVAAEQPAPVSRRKRIQQPWSLILQLLSIGFLLLAIAQLRFGPQAMAPLDHVLILETSAWMGAHSGAGGNDRTSRGGTLMDEARERAKAYVHSVPSKDRIMLVRADALTTPATAFEPDHARVEAAIDASQPGATALNIDEALTFARQIQTQSGRRSGEIVFIGTGRVVEHESSPGMRIPHNLRVIPVRDSVENCGLRKISVRRASAEPDLWEIYVTARNYGAERRSVNLVLSFGPTPGGAPAAVRIAAQRLVLPPGLDREVTVRYRTRAAGYLEATLLPHDGFARDDHATLEIPAQKNLTVGVYSDQPELLRPVLTASPRVNAAFRKPSEYRPGKDGDLVVLDRFRPSVKPECDSIWIDPPAEGSPIPVRARLSSVPFAQWLSDHPLGAGLRAKDFRLDATSVFERAPDDIRIGEVQSGPVVIARPGKPKIVVFGFHPGLSVLRYELATPLLFANILRWMAPEIFRRWDLSTGSVGIVRTALDSDVQDSALKVISDQGTPVPFTVRDGSLVFFSGTPGTVRVLAGDREYVYSLTLPQLGESRWQIPPEARRGIPRVPQTGGATDIWPWLALVGASGLLAEWLLFGSFRQRRLRRSSAPVVMKKAS